MVPLHIEDAGGALAVTFQRQTPGWMTDAGRIFGARLCRLRCHEPASIGGAGEYAIGLTKKKPHHPVLAGAEGQTPACGQVEEARVASDLGHHCREPAATKSLLEHPEGVGGPGDADDDQTFGIETEAGKPGPIRKPGFSCRGGFDDPQNGTIVLGGETRKDGDGEAGHGGGVAALGATHFMKRSTAQTTGQHAVEIRNGEGEDGPGAACRQGGRRAGLQWRRI
jgi:hypothetical protein